MSCHLRGQRDGIREADRKPRGRTGSWHFSCPVTILKDVVWYQDPHSSKLFSALISEIWCQKKKKDKRKRGGREKGRKTEGREEQKKERMEGRKILKKNERRRMGRKEGRNKGTKEGR